MGWSYSIDEYGETDYYLIETDWTPRTKAIIDRTIEELHDPDDPRPFDVRRSFPRQHTGQL